MAQYANTRAQWTTNAALADVPALPAPRKDGAPILLRIHVSGDFDTPEYVHAWRFALQARPDVVAWAYTRSWRVAELLPALDKLRALPNVQMFASMDTTIDENPPEGWRVAYIADDERASGYACPEQSGRKADCSACGYCFRGKRGNVVFTAH